MDFSSLSISPLQSTLNKYNITILENYGLNQKTGFWSLKFTFDYELEKGIELSYKYDSTGNTWTLEILKCKYLSIENKKQMASFDMTDELAIAKELSKLQECSTSTEKLRQYLEINVVPLVLKKIKYTRFVPQFRFFLSHKSRDKPAMRTFQNGLKFLGYSIWIDEADMPMGANVQAALKTSIDNCSCFIAWLNADYFSSDYCRAELVYAKKCGKIIIPFGAYHEIKDHLTGELQFLRQLLICDPEAMSFLELLRRIDETLFGFEKMAIV